MKIQKPFRHRVQILFRYPRLEPRDADCAAKLKKRTLTNLCNERPVWLDLTHKKLDAAAAAAYGCPASPPLKNSAASFPAAKRTRRAINSALLSDLSCSPPALGVEQLASLIIRQTLRPNRSELGAASKPTGKRNIL